MGLVESKPCYYYFNITKKQQCHTFDLDHFTETYQSSKSFKPNHIIFDDNYDLFDLGNVINLCQWDITDTVVCVCSIDSKNYYPPYIFNGDNYSTDDPIIVYEMTEFDDDFEFNYDETNVIKKIVLINENTNVSNIYYPNDFASVLKQVCVINYNLIKKEYFKFHITLHSSESVEDKVNSIQSYNNVTKLANWNQSSDIITDFNKNNENNVNNIIVNPKKDHKRKRDKINLNSSDDAIVQIILTYYDDHNERPMININKLNCLDSKGLDILAGSNINIKFLNANYTKYFEPTISVLPHLSLNVLAHNDISKIFEIIDIKYKYSSDVEPSNKKIKKTKSKSKSKSNECDNNIKLNDIACKYNCEDFEKLESIFHSTYSFI